MQLPPIKLKHLLLQMQRRLHMKPTITSLFHSITPLPTSYEQAEQLYTQTFIWSGDVVIYA